ncbi:hypothetical protein EPUL_005308 [Erysiphe pulchra]|uniref:Uncharacterized protein n=1 Tax=Erysiphe pulchra TaxID=225359 RepID=A0A2S4PQJ0_9PEZI|nr:hypothetical protein EPUL_005308 [Erysiphe pulchra]
MAPPVFNKRGPPPDPPDTGNRISKTTSALNKLSGATISKPRSTPQTNVTLHESSILEKMLGFEQFLLDDQADKVDMDVEPAELPINTISSDPFEEEFPPLPGFSDDNAAKNTTECGKINVKNRSVTLLMDAIKGLLDLTNPYLKELEEEHPGIGTDFMALLADGASRAMRGERVYTDLSNISFSNPKVSNPWAEKVGAAENGQNVSLEKQTIRASPPRGQSKEDRRVIIRLGLDHEARKTGSFELRQKIQQLIPDKSLIADVWTVPSGVAILASTPAKAATLLQYKEKIENKFGDAKVERQETWTTFVVGLIPKKIRGLDGFYDSFDGLLQEELAPIRDAVPIRHVSWTRRSLNDEPYGKIRICVPEIQASRFPSRLRLFGEAVSVQRIRKRNLIITCEKCYGFHATRTCAQTMKCKLCGIEAHDGPYKTIPKCLNCRGPHSSIDISCPARPCSNNGVLIRSSRIQLQHIRLAGQKEFANITDRQSSDSPKAANAISGTEDNHTSN